jgi:putative molybdopterin biosynthesis protein
MRCVRSPKAAASWPASTCRRTQGLIVPPGNPLSMHRLADALAPGLRFASRQTGSGTRLLTEHLMQEQGVDPRHAELLDRLVEDSHLAVAAAVAGGHADAGIGVAAAAAQFKLGFVPLVEEDYYLVCLQDSLSNPAVQALQAALSDPAWAAELVQLPGYSALPHAGEVLSLTRALPWWRFRRPKTLAPG